MATEIIRAETDYALRALLELSGAEGVLSCAAIARACGVPHSFTYKILQKLVRAGLVTSEPGRAGGFRIARRPASITLADVAQAVQGPVWTRRCLMDPATCVRAGTCRISARLGQLQEQIDHFLHQTTLADVSAETGRPHPPSRRRGRRTK